MAGFCEGCFVPEVLRQCLEEPSKDKESIIPVVGDILTLGAVGECPAGQPSVSDEGDNEIHRECNNTNASLMDIMGGTVLGFYPALYIDQTDSEI